MLAVVTGPSGGDKAAAEQALLDRALTEFAWVFTKGRLFVMDRNFPGTARIARMIKVTHVLIRLKSDIRVTKIGGFLPDGSYMADICGSGQKVRMRVIEYYVHVEGQEVPEMFCLVTDLDDWRSYPAGMLAAAYKWRWDGSETALREAKSAIRGAGPSTGPIFRSHCPACPAGARCLDHRLRAGPRRGPPGGASAAPARKGRRAGQPVQPREISFTAARRAAITTVRNGCATASLPAAIITARRSGTLRDLGKRRVTIDRDRHRDRKTKARQASPQPDAPPPPARPRPASPSAAPSPPSTAPPAPPEAAPAARGTGRRPGTTSGPHPSAKGTITTRNTLSPQADQARQAETAHLHGIGNSRANRATSGIETAA